MIYKSFIIFLYFGYTLKTKCRNLAVFTTTFFPHFWRLETPKSLDFLFLSFASWQNLTNKKKAALLGVLRVRVHFIKLLK
jgi:hypothetical protein